MRSLLLFAIITCANIALFSQSALINPDVQKFISSPEQQGIFYHSAGTDYKILDSYTDTDRGITYYYVGQTINGYEVQNSQITLFRGRDGKVRSTASRIINPALFTIESSQAVLEPADAIRKVSGYYGIRPLEIRSESVAEPVYKIQDLSPNPVKPRLKYLVSEDKLILVYVMEVMPVTDDKMWQLYISASTGEIVSKESLTTECKFDHQYLQRPGHQCEVHIPEATTANPPDNGVETATYRVYELPAEAPSFAASVLVSNPSDPIASPYGWHDSDASPSVDKTNLDGVNVYAYNDANGDYLPDSDVDGGPQLNFDKPYDFRVEPSVSKDAAAINLFYMINMLHDFSWHFGFTEAAGNFQKINYTPEGAGGDAVRALSQYSNGTTEKNNADFSTPVDGNSGTMRMFLWDNATGIFSATAPADTFSNYQVGTADFGKRIDNVAITGDLVYVNDAGDDTHFFCGNISNAADVNGKVALIDRGGCEFGTKAYKAQQAGAIGVVIVNFENSTLNMAEGAEGNRVTIPVVMINKVAGDIIKTKLQITKVQARFHRADESGPDFLDASLDNGIIAHEFGHGISNRLTGGRTNSSCLGNDEQMGEGWSDFFALVTTRKPSDTGTTPRGVGSFALAESPTGKGIRTYPYSTDMSVNPHTMENIIGSSGPHYLGEIWVSALWDLYWKMIEVHGDDKQLYGGTGGNSKAIELVMQGMKLQPCRPGMLDGRNAILAADSLLYGGENACLIWEVFARRGMGFHAEQNNNNNRNDNITDFATYPFCQNKIEITKTVSREVDPEGIIDVQIDIINYKNETTQNVLVVDHVADHTSYVPGSGGELIGGDVHFTTSELEKGASQTFKYQIKVDAGYKSLLLATDEIETDDPDRYIPASEEGNVFFNFNTEQTPENENTWGVNSESGNYITSLILENEMHVSGVNPSLVIHHRFNTQQSIDGGYVLYSEDKDTYTKLNNQFYRGGNFQKISYNTFPFPDLNAFSGNSDGYIHSFIDLTELNNKDLQFKFTYGASDGDFVPDGGWFINRADIVEPVFVNSEACVTINGTDPECAQAAERGTWVKYNNTVANRKTELDFESVIYPNPGDGRINIAWSQQINGDMQIDILNANAVNVFNKTITVRPGIKSASVDLSTLAPGMYFVKLQTGNYVSVRKYLKF